jgi:hypothetical protein
MGSSNGRTTTAIGAALIPAFLRALSRASRASGDGRGAPAGGAGAAAAAVADVGWLLPSAAAGGVTGRLGSRGRLWP